MLHLRVIILTGQEQTEELFAAFAEKVGFVGNRYAYELWVTCGKVRILR